MEWTTAARLTLSLGKVGYDQRHTIQRFITFVKANFDFGRTQIVVTGRASAGKTLLVSQMEGRARDPHFSLPLQSTTVEVDAITLGKWTKLVRVIPSQVGKRIKGEREAFIDNSSLEGVIHVVDFGYTIPRDKAVIENHIKTLKLESIEKLRKRNLENEIITLIETLTNIKNAISANGGPKWIIIAVNKVDLFPEKKDEALQFYHPEGNSKFSKMLNEFVAEIGKNNIAVYVLQMCTLPLDHPSEFVWNGNSIQSNLQKGEHTEIVRNFIAATALITGSHL